MRLGITAEGLSAHRTHSDTALGSGGFWRVKRKANAQSTVLRPWAAIRLITTQKWLKCWSILTLVPDGYQPSNCYNSLPALLTLLSLSVRQAAMISDGSRDSLSPLYPILAASKTRPTGKLEPNDHGRMPWLARVVSDMPMCNSRV